jgi:hypothetical protein
MMPLTAGALVIALLAPTFQEALPDRFASPDVARSAGCQPAALKGPEVRICIVVIQDANPMVLGVYEESPGGTVALSHRLAIPSWGWDAKLSVVDVLDRGTEWLVIRTPGMHGTGLSQEVLFVLGWDGARFRAVVAESLGYRCGRPSAPADYVLWVTDVFERRADALRLHLRYQLTRNGETIGRWAAALQWNPAGFVFEPVQSTTDMANPLVTRIQEGIGKARAYAVLHPLDPVKGAAEWLHGSGLMNVLDSACVS